MLHVDRSIEPAVFRGKLLERERKRLRDFFKKKSAAKLQTRFEFFLPGKEPMILRQLTTLFHGKCAYCEQPVEQPGFYNVDSFRPKMEALNLDGKTSPLHYWWLAYEWSNLYFTCGACNKLKGSRFPVEGRRASVGEDTQDEKRLLLDPCGDHPEQVLLFDEQGRVASEDPRGRATIEILGLNRMELLTARQHLLRAITADWKHAERTLLGRGRSIAPLRTLLDAKRPFAAMTRQFVQAWGRELRQRSPEVAADLQAIDMFQTALPPETQGDPSAKSAVARVVSEFHKAKSQQVKFSVEDESRKHDYYLSSQLIERIEIRNFRVLKNVQINLPLNAKDRGSWLLLLGENATGKSSILQAVALALSSPAARKRLARHINPSSYLRIGCSSGYVRVFLTGHTDPVELHLQKTAPFVRSSESLPKVLLLGYGATRLLRRAGTRRVDKPGASKVDNLFDPFCELNDGVPWLYELNSKDFGRIARSLKELLPEGERIRLKTKSRPHRHLQAIFDGTSIPLQELSAGYRSVVSMALDIMSVLRLRWDAMENAEGIVLIDEIDAHLHPQWKMQIVGRLRKVFPHLQFLVTSHEPLTLRGLHEREVAVMRRADDGGVQLITNLPSPADFRVEQLLTSDFFGLNSTVDPMVEKEFDEYYALLAIKKPTAVQRRRVQELRGALDGRRLMGTTLRESLMYESIDKLLAEHRSRPTKSTPQLKQAAVQELSKLWSAPSSEAGQ